jgi:hypothetical protein
MLVRPPRGGTLQAVVTDPFEGENTILLGPLLEAPGLLTEDELQRFLG